MKEFYRLHNTLLYESDGLKITNLEARTTPLEDLFEISILLEFHMNNPEMHEKIANQFDALATKLDIMSEK
jgi:hypothetical protein